MPKKKELDNESIYDSLDQSISWEDDENEFSYQPEELHVTAPKAEEKIGFFAGLWNSITNWFKNLFKSAPKQEPAPAIVEEPKPAIVEEPKPATVKEEKPEEDVSAYLRSTDLEGARKWEESQAIREKLNNLEHRNMAFEEQVQEIIRKGPDDVRTFLAGVSDGSFKLANAQIEEGMETARQEGRDPEKALLDMVKESMKIARREATVTSLKEKINEALGRPDENHPSEFRKQLGEALNTGSDETLELLKNAKPEELHFLAEQYDEMIKEAQWEDTELPSFEEMLQTGLKQVEGHGLYEQKKAAHEAGQAVRGNSMEEWNHNLKSDLIDRVGFVFKDDAEFASSDFGKQIMDVIDNGDARTVDKLRCFAPDNWKQLKDAFDKQAASGNATDVSTLKNMLNEMFDKITDLTAPVEQQPEQIAYEIEQNEVPSAEQSQATELQGSQFGNELDEMPDEPVAGPMNG